MNFKLIEPLRDLFKDEFESWYKLGLPPELVQRHPFPGPGLGVRIIGALLKKIEILQEADKIFIDIFMKISFIMKFGRLLRC